MSAYVQNLITKSVGPVCENSASCQQQINTIIETERCHSRILLILAIFEPIITLITAILWLILRYYEKRRSLLPPFPHQQLLDNNAIELQEQRGLAQQKIGRAVQQECRDRSRMPSSA
eukprot:TRINITY_DN76205_c0_g1_i1.p1 TRINITY_DN76205_c0_g1~~TRINITY_DN76205_c0_g1_i1.p1  ORF type:complete len:118 (-),score=7.80 TRINITY_DN76205_c0_g1_i1:10-363(-)